MNELLNCPSLQDLHLNMTYHSISVDELLEKSSLYVAPIDPALWIGGLMKYSDNIVLCLKVGLYLSTNIMISKRINITE